MLETAINGIKLDSRDRYKGTWKWLRSQVAALTIENLGRPTDLHSPAGRSVGGIASLLAANIHESSLAWKLSISTVL